MPALFDSKQFVITSNKIPPQWIIEATYQLDGIYMRPSQWTPELWDDAYDGDPAALELYKKIARGLASEDPVDN